MMKMIKAYFNRREFKSNIAKRVSRYYKTINNFQPAKRFLALSLITALLLPVFYFADWQKASAQSLRTSFSNLQMPAVNSAPPEPFHFSDSSNISTAALSTAASLNASIDGASTQVINFFKAPEPPPGFEMAKTASPASQMLASSLSSISTSIGSLFGFFKDASSAAKDSESNEETNNESEAVSTSAAPPLPAQPLGIVTFDFDDDGKADIGRWNKASSEWKVLMSSNNSLQTETVGSSSSVIAPGDFDGDGITDYAAFDAGTWTIKKSGSGTTQTGSFGASDDKPVVGDYDGDGVADLAVFRPSNGTWYIFNSASASVTSAAFGASTDEPVPGNYDGDNKTDIAVFRPSTGEWHVLGSSAGYSSLQWGLATDVPVPADYDGDGKTDKAVYRGSSGTWYVYYSDPLRPYTAQVWGNYGDQPVPADYDGDGKADHAVWRPTTGVWHLLKSSNSSNEYHTLGSKTDKAVPAAYLKPIGAEVYSYDFMQTRLSPKNATGGTNLYSQNFSWSSGLVALPGRAGLDAGFGISYNSLVWTKHTTTSNNQTNTTMVFDADSSNVSPGFRFGFPTIEPAYYEGTTSKFAYLMVTPSGARVEFRQTPSIDTYETVDSSYSLIKIDNSGSPLDPIENIKMTLYTKDGTQMSYAWIAGAYRCTKIKDTNGNY